MFHRKSFKQASFSPTSWRFDGASPAQPRPDVFPVGAPARSTRRKRRDRDDDVLLFLLR